MDNDLKVMREQDLTGGERRLVEMMALLIQAVRDLNPNRPPQPATRSEDD